MKATINDKGVLTIEVQTNKKPEPSKTGKPVIIGFNAYIKQD